MKSTILQLTCLVTIVAGLTSFSSAQGLTPATAQTALTDGGNPITTQDTGASSNWSGGQEVAASDAAALDFFGNVVAVSGDVAVIGASDALINNNAAQGAAYVFVRAGGSWSQVAKLTADDGAANDLFGSAVAISGTTVLVGASNATIAGTSVQGAAYLYSGSGTSWSQVAKLTASDGAQNDYFGFAVALGENLALISATDGGIEGNYQGKVYVFAGSGGKWTEVQTLTPDDGAPADRFGSSIALDGSKALFGAAGAEINGNTFRGAAYIFQAANGTWNQSAKLISADGAQNDGFGWSVALHGSTAVVGAPGATVDNEPIQGTAYLFDDTGTGWSQTTKLAAGDGAAGAALGWSVAAGENSVLVGAFNATIDGDAAQGAVYAYARTGESWTQTDKLTVRQGNANDEFGRAIALDGDVALIGAAHGNDDGTGSSGKAYFFEQPQTDVIFANGFDPVSGR